MNGTPENQDTDAIVPLAEGFEDGGREEWTALVEKALKGRPIDKALNKTTYEGVTLRGLYRGDDHAGGAPDVTSRGGLSPDRTQAGWDIRQMHAHPDPAALNRDLIADLDGGAKSARLRIASPSGGLAVGALADLDQALARVDLSATGLGFKAGARAFPMATMVVALARKRGIDPRALNGGFGVDPLGTLAETGGLPGALDRQFGAMAALSSWCAANASSMRAVEVDTSVYHDAGASETQDLAFAAATGVAYLRAMTGRGLTLEQACGQICFTLSVGADVFQVIAKLRALRRIWTRIIEASGGGPADRATLIGAVTAARMLSRRDAWVNQLRATASCFAAGVGGADGITVRAHTDALGLPEPLARRVARNIQTILVQESSLARVADPAGGSYYVEQLTDEYAHRAWAIFQDIERAGGMAEALMSGEAAYMVEASWAERERNLARRRDELTGVSSFPDLDESKVSVVAPETAARPATAGEVEAPAELDVDAFSDAVSRGAGLTALMKPLEGEAVSCEALEPHRLGEAFEALRDAADARTARSGSRPTVFVARLGTPADYTGRVVFAKSYFAAAGIDAAEGDVSVETVAGAYKESGAELAVICSSDTIYEADAARVAEALKQAGAPHVVLAGRPGEREDGYRASGIDRFIHAGDDMLATLRDVAREIGMIEP